MIDKEITAAGAALLNAARQAEFRRRKAADGINEVRGIFAHPDDHAEVKEAAAKIARRRTRLAKRGAPYVRGNAGAVGDSR